MPEPLQQLTVADFIRFLVRYWKLIAATTVSGIAVAVLIALMSTRTYQATIVIAPAAPDRTAGVIARLAGQFGALGGLVGDLGLDSGGSSKDAWAATLRSDDLIRKFVERNDLMPVLFADEWDAARKRWAPNGAKDEVPTLNDAIRVFKRRILSISEDRRTGLLTLDVEWRDRDAASKWANDFVGLANEVIRDRAIRENKRSIAFLDQELEKTTAVERRQIIYKLIESRTQEAMFASGRPEYAFTVVDPAVTPDRDGYVSPKRRRMAVAGAVLGCLLGGVLALAHLIWSQSRTPSTPA